LYIPLEALTSDSGVPVVYRQSSGRVTKQEIETGAINDDEVIVLRGLEENDKVLLAPPGDRDRLTISRLPNSTARPRAAGGDTAAPNVPLSTRKDSIASKAATPAPAQRPAGKTARAS